MAESTQRVIRDYLIATAIAAVVAVLIRFFLLEAYRIPTQAMKPSLEPGDTIFVAKWPFGFRIPFTDQTLIRGRLPERGEVIIYQSPTDVGVDYIKRVIGLPGDTVEIRKSQLILNNKPLLAEKTKTGNCGQEKTFGKSPEKFYEVCWESPALDDAKGVKVPDDSIFVMGDLRTQQRGWGVVPITALKGKAMWIWLSFEPNPFGGPSQSIFARFRRDRVLRRIE